MILKMKKNKTLIFSPTVDFNGSMYYEKSIKNAANVSGVNIDYFKNQGFDKWKASETDIRFNFKVNGNEEELNKFKIELKSIQHKKIK